jgi:hypothetical protein
MVSLAGRFRLVGIVGASALMMAGCGKSATAPSNGVSLPGGGSLHFRSGPQTITFLGFGVSSDPQFPPCTPLGVPRRGTSITIEASLELVGSEWIARADPSVGTLEICIPHQATSAVQGDLIVGTASGSARDM